MIRHRSGLRPAFPSLPVYLYSTYFLQGFAL